MLQGFNVGFWKSSGGGAPPSGSQTYDIGSGNFIVPALVTLLKTIEVWGAGAGAGSGSDGGAQGGSGGAGSGAYCLKNNLTVTPGQSIAYVVGAPGIGGDIVGMGTPQPGTDGGQSSFAGTYIANGGIATTDNQTTGGAGGTATGGDTNTSGNPGTGKSGNNGGVGGSAPNGGTGGPGGTSLVDAGAGTAPGSGGGGGGKRTNGGNGAYGRVKITW